MLAKIPLPFPTMCLYNTGFLHILQPKQYIARLNAEADTRIKLFSIQPNTRDFQIHITMPLFAKDLFWKTGFLKKPNLIFLIKNIFIKRGLH